MPEYQQPRPCEVLVDGRWLYGALHGWTRRDENGTWWGVVEYVTGEGRHFYQARPQTEIRPLPDEPS